jgi:hypothetical protein
MAKKNPGPHWDSSSARPGLESCARDAYLGEPLRQDHINVLRSSPFRFFADASLLQSVIFCLLGGLRRARLLGFLGENR